MMNSPRFLRVETILAAASRAGRKVAAVTAKDKLREILSYGMQGVGFSAEKADEAQQETHGIENVLEIVGRPKPPIYSPDASLFVLQAGVALIEQGISDFCYLSLTDYMQHKYAPRDPEAIAFYADLDAEIGKLRALGAVLGATADHGMNAKQNPDGSPNVLYLETLLTERFGAGFRVILPITDPYVGSFAVVHLPDPALLEAVFAYMEALEGVTEVYGKTEAARRLELPEDRIGDLIALSGRNVVLGRTPAHHDLSQLESGLRSHGGRYEEMVPFLVSEPLNALYTAKANGDPRNFDIFDFTLNGGAS
jgi:phosphonoacetate hydrolase